MPITEQQVKRIKEVNLNPGLTDSLDDEYVHCFIQCLENDRKTHYVLVEKPDIKNRNTPQPDYLYKETNNPLNKQVVIEYTRIFESEEQVKRQSYKVKQLEKVGRPYMAWITTPTPSELGNQFNALVLQKFQKGQLSSFTDAEKILLCRNWWTGATPDIYFQAEPYLQLHEMKNHCDHIYVIIHARPFAIIEIY